MAYRVIQVVGAGIFFYLTYYSLRYSQYMFPQTREFPMDVVGVPFYSILAVGGVCAALFLLMLIEKKLTEQSRAQAERTVLTLSLLWIACWCFWWISTLDRIPVGDQAYVYGGASYFLEGNYIFLCEGCYCEMYPHQLGLIAFTELLFMVFGLYNYFAFEIVCAAMAVGIAFLGYCLLREFEVPFGGRILYCLLVMGCVPLICYTSWVYGDVPSIFFAMLAAYFACRWSNCQKKRWLAGVVAASVMAMLVRKNSMILLIALCLLALVHMIYHRRWQVGVMALLTVSCSFLVYQGIYKMYEIRSGVEHSEGLPVNSWIAMGLMEQEGRCGWYNNLAKETLYSLDCDYEATRARMAEYIEERLDVFRADPEYGRWFFKQKILSQWNDPLYQSVYFSAQDLERNPAKPGSFLEGLYCIPEVHNRVFRFADIMQFIVYLGMLFYYLFAVRRDTQPLMHLLAVTIIGGFFFSILWEAKARYIFPYYVMMYPLAVTGYFEAMRNVMAFKSKIDERYRSGESEKVTE